MERLRVRDLMKTEVVTVGPGDSVARVRNLMYEQWVRFIPVVDSDRRLLGLVTYRDLLRRSLIEQSDRPVWIEQETLENLQADDVAQHVVDQVEPDADLGDAGRQLLESKKGCLLVVDDERLIGILTEGDFVRHVVGTVDREGGLV